jgi:hypothetical protein
LQFQHIVSSKNITILSLFCSYNFRNISCNNEQVFYILKYYVNFKLLLIATLITLLSTKLCFNFFCGWNQTRRPNFCESYSYAVNSNNARIRRRSWSRIRRGSWYNYNIGIRFRSWIWIRIWNRIRISGNYRIRIRIWIRIDIWSWSNLWTW